MISEQTTQREQKAAARRSKYIGRNMYIEQVFDGPRTNIANQLNSYCIPLPPPKILDETACVELYVTKFQAASDYNLLVFVNENGDEISTQRMEGY